MTALTDLFRKRSTRGRRLGVVSSRHSLRLESLEDRLLLAGDPVVTLSHGGNDFLGEQVQVAVRFDNQHATDVGYGPFVDLQIPVNGEDGVGGVGVDGLTFVSATYLGTSVSATVLTFPDDGGGTGTVQHPLAVDATGAPLSVTGAVGDQLVVLQLPFGSFTADQPPVDVSVQLQLSQLADLGQPLPIYARTGFQYGADAIDNPATDPTILSSGDSSTDPATWNSVAQVVPTLMTLGKTYLGPENETATGPNFPRQYQLTVDIADGQTVTDLDIVDLLPNNVVLQSVDSISPAGSVTTLPTSTPANPPNNELRINIPTATGAGDVTITYTVYFPFADADGSEVLDSATGDDGTSPNDVSALGDWTPIDVRDAGGTDNAAASGAGPEHVLIPKSLAVQKSVLLQSDPDGNGYSPGDVVQYHLQMQVSDFFGFDNLAVDDVLSDGLRFDTTFLPTLSWTEHGVTDPAAALNSANYTITDHFTGAVIPVAPLNGTQDLVFRISDEMVLRGADSRLLGGVVPTPAGTVGPAPDPGAFNAGPTTAEIVFRAVIQEAFTDDFPSGEASVDEGDQLNNGVTVTGDVLAYADLAATGFTESDTSAAGFQIVHGPLTKTIYAINGSTTLPTPISLTPADTVTYRLKVELPTSDVEDLELVDYLPLPVLDATELTTFVDLVDATLPAAGNAKFGPDDTFRAVFGATPSMSADPVANSITFTYGDHSNIAGTPKTVDILFTVTASDAPFADGLMLTNQARRMQETTNAGSLLNDAIVQVRLDMPVLSVTKGVVAATQPDAQFAPTPVGPVTFSSPGSAGFRGSAVIHSAGLAATPIDSNVASIDAGDLVTFAIVVENTGASRKGAFDVRVRDEIPAGFQIPAGGAGLNLSVTDGSGASFTTTTLGGGLFDPAGGIELSDPGPTLSQLDETDAGALDAYDASSGHNVLVVTYDLEAVASVEPSQVITNTATLFHYAGVEGGSDFTPTDLTDDASATIASVQAAKSVDSTNQPHTVGLGIAAIGEMVTYHTLITIPEGTTSVAQLTDTPNTGLAIVGLLSVTGSADLATSIGSFAAVQAAAVIPADGSSLTLDFGTLTNVNRDDTADETIEVFYRAVALNDPTVDRGDALVNLARFGWAGGSRGAVAPSLVVVEPQLTPQKTIAPSSGQATDPFVVTVDLAHAAASNADTFEVSLVDALPAGLVFNGGLTHTSGLAPTTLGEAAGIVTATWNSFPAGSTAQIQFNAVLDGSVAPDEIITNDAVATWSSLPGDVTTQQTSNALSTERTGDPGDPGGAANDYRATGTDDIVVVAPVVIKLVDGTNQPHTVGLDVAIGEIVTYRTEVMIPQSTLTGVQFVDTPDTGLAIVDVVSLTASAALSTTIGTFADVQAGAVIAANGSSVTFDFATLTNIDNDSGVGETIEFVYRAIVLNDAVNNRAEQLHNEAEISWDTGQSAVGSAPNVTVVEPELSVVVSDATPAVADAGDVVTFAIELVHSPASDADAFDVVLQDLIDSVTNHLAYVPSSLWIINSGGAVLDSNSDAGGDLQAVWSAFPQGATATIVFHAVVENTAPPAATLTNQANVAWTGLPGEVSTPQTSHALSVERSGNASDPGGAVNDYAATDAGVVRTVPSQFLKVIQSSSLPETGVGQHDPAREDLLIGEEVTYSLTVTLPEGTTPLIVTDQLPTAAGLLSLVSAQVTSVGANLSIPAGQPVLTTSDTNSDTLDDRLEITFGDVVNTPDGVSGPQDQIEIEVTARVEDVPANANAQLLVNEATLNYGAGTVTASAESEVVEPLLVVDKSIDTSTGPAGVVVTYTVLVEHAALSAAAAYDVAMEDVLADPGVALLPGSVTTSRGSVAAGNDAADTTVRIEVADLLLGEQMTVTYQARIRSDLAVGANVPNTASAEWDQTPGPGGRLGSANGSANFTTTAPEVDLQLTKVDDREPALVDGQLVYTLVVVNLGPSTATAVQMVDTLPAAVTFVSAVASQGSASEAGGIVTVDLGTLDPQQSETVTLTVGTPSGEQTVVNSAVVAANETDTDLSNNTDNEPTEIVAGSSVSGYVFVDTNRDGVFQATELPLPGATVRLVGTDDQGQRVDLSTVTDVDGRYEFIDLRPGQCEIIETQPELFVDGPEVIGSEGGTVPSNDRIAIALPAGADAVDYHFTELGLRGIAIGKRMLLASRARVGTSPLDWIDEPFFHELFGTGSQADLDGDGDGDSDDFQLFRDNLGGRFGLSA